MTKDERAAPPTFDAALTTAYGELTARAVDEAGRLDSVDTELALLRIWLLETSREDKNDRELMLKMFREIVRAAVAKYRLSPRQAEDLGAAVAQVLKLSGDQLGVGSGEEV